MPPSSTRNEQSWTRLRRYLWAERGSYVLGIGMLLLTNVATATVPYLTKLSFDAFEGRDQGVPWPLGMILPGTDDIVGRVRVLALCIVGAAVVMGLCRVASRMLVFNGGRRVEFVLRNDLYAHLLTLGPSFFSRMAVGDLVARTTSDIAAVRLLGGPGVLHCANTALVYVAAIVPMSLISPSLTAAALAPLLLLFVVTRKVGPRIYEKSYAAQDELSRLSARANESIEGIRVLKAYVREPHQREQFEHDSDRYRKAYLSFVLYRAVLLPILAGMGGIGTLMIVWFGGRAVIASALSLGDFVALLGYLAMLMWPTVALSWMISLIQRGRAAMDRLGDILDTVPDVQGRGAMQLPDSSGASSVEFRGLSFGYPLEPHGRRDVLHDLSLRIEPGEHVLLVGPVGAGKTTLVSILPQLLPVAPGTVFLDGADVQGVSLQELRSRIAFGPQDPFLFSMTVRDTIGFADQAPDPEAVREAAVLACLDDEIQGFVRGFDTVVGERGFTLSGGQRQRMTIARAAMRRPSLWIFDDCLSSVDVATEQTILGRLRELGGGATTLYISHRILGFEGVDRIVVLRDGRITEQGSHDELVGQDGWYARLYRRQRLDADLAEKPASALVDGGPSGAE